MVLAQALAQIKDLNCFWKVTQEFHYHGSPQDQAVHRKTYVESIQKAVTVCCPRGAGLNSIRFFETLAMARIPILISDDAVLPLEDQIDYATLILRLPEVRIPEIGSVPARFGLLLRPGRKKLAADAWMPGEPGSAC